MIEVILVQMTYRELQDWLRSGLRDIQGKDMKSPPVSLVVRGGSVDNVGPLSVLVALPRKYAAMRTHRGVVPVPADEIETVTLASQELTNEVMVRTEQLGVTWIPFTYRKGWIRSSGRGEERLRRETADVRTTSEGPAGNDAPRWEPPPGSRRGSRGRRGEPGPLLPLSDSVDQVEGADQPSILRGGAKEAAMSEESA